MDGGATGGGEYGMSKSSGADILSVYRKAVPEVIRRPVRLLRRHWQRQLWPFFQRQSVRLLDSNVRSMSKRLSTLQGSYRGQRCFIMGNGPSLNRMDLELFGQEHVWGLNKCYLLFDRISWRPGFYVAVDARLASDVATEVNSLVRDYPQTKFFFPVSFREQRVVRSDANVYWYHEVPLASVGYTYYSSNIDELTIPPDLMFTRDASRWVSGVTTVAIAALQLAVYLGFDPIYLIGCDTSFTTPSTVRVEGRNVVEVVSTQDDDPSHFDPRYLGRGSKWALPDVNGMLYHYQQAKQVCESLGVGVYNATVGGKLEVFPRVDYRDLF